MKKYTLILFVLLCSAVTAWAQSARLQVVHNSPDPVVDVYINGGIALDNFEFRTATPFQDVPAGVPLTISVAPSTSTSVADAIADFEVTLEAGKTYTVFAGGIVGSPDTPFGLFINADARETSIDPEKVDVAVFHGSPNAPAVDVDAVFLANNVVSNLAYGQFTGYLQLDSGKYDLAIRATGNSGVVASFRADLTDLKGQAATVFASGLLGGSPAFGLYAVLPDGTVAALPLTPTAQVQVIHNSPEPTVDVYAGNTQIINDFAFRTATPYVTVPADININFGIALSSSTSAADAIYNQNASFEAGKAYTVIAGGIVGNATTPFSLFAAEARTSAADTNLVDVKVFHGSPDAPAVDVDAVFVANNLVSNIAFGQFSNFLSIPPAKYDLAVRPAGLPAVVASFRADLSGLKGRSAVVIASGLLSGTPGFGLFAVLADGTVAPLGLTPTARLQVVHNSPNPTVDVYAGNSLLINDFAFRTATPFLTVPADREIGVGVALPNSTSAADAIATIPVTLETGKTYTVFASGIVGNATTPFTLIPVESRESAAVAGTVDIAVFHGSPNAPAVDVDAVFVANNVVSNLAYGSGTGYLTLQPILYDLAVRPANSTVVVATQRADLSGLAGGAGIVFASGLVGGNPGFGLFVVLPNGMVQALPNTPLTRVQIIHNSPEPTVDVYAGNSLLLNDFEFRTATPFIDVPANRDITIGVALPNSTSAADAIATFPVNFASNNKYTVFAQGIVGNATTPFTLQVANDARENAPAGLVSLSILHGSPDAPTVDVAERLAGSLAEGLSYGDLTPYFSLPTGAYFIDVKLAGTNTIAATFLADLSSLSGVAARVFASGLIGGTPGFGLYAALANGTVVELPYFPVARVQIIHNSPEPTVDLYANGEEFIQDFEFRTATEFIYLPADFPISLAVAPGNSSSVNDAIAEFDVTFENGKTYVVVASGLVGGNPGFDLIVNDQARERSLDPGKIDLAVLHGAPDAPAVNVSTYPDGTLLLPDFAYGDFTDYLSLDPQVLLLDVVPALPNATSIGVWGTSLEGAEGIAAVVFASGLVNDDPAFDLYVALPDGFVFPLPVFTRGQVIHNSPAPDVDVYLDDTQVLDDFTYHSATGFGLLPAREPFTLSVAPASSTSVDDAIYDLDVPGLDPAKAYIIMAAGVVGSSSTPFQLYVNDGGRERAQTPGNVELSLFHGSPDAPEVDVKLAAGPVIYDNVAFGEFTDYLSVPPSEYVIQITPSNDNNTVVKTYLADLAGAANVAGVVYASGYLGSTPGFETWVALADGTTFPLPEFSATTEIDGLSRLNLAPNPTSDALQVRFELENSQDLRYGVRDQTGRLVLEGDFGKADAGENIRRIEVGNCAAGMYFLELYSENGKTTQKFVVVK
jgi:hypothetical protein